MGCFKNVFKNQIASNIKTHTKASLYKIDSVCLKHNPQGQKQEFNLHGKSKRRRKLQNSSLEEYTYLVLFVFCGALGCLEKYGDYKF